MFMASMSVKTDKAPLSQRIGKKARKFRSQIWLQGMVAPGIVWLIVFCYIPMYGIVIAFNNYQPGQPFFSGPWVGLDHFRVFFHDKYAVQALWNTLIISALKLLILFPAPIIFSLLLNEVRCTRYKKFIQSVSYLPFFISWVIMAGLLKSLLGVNGVVNSALTTLGLQSESIAYLTKPELFRPIAVLSDLWKSIGWSSILYMAAISNIPQDMYESAFLDGASRFQRAMRITLPSIMPTVSIMLIFNVAGIMGSNFDQHLLLSNPQNSMVASTLDTYIYGVGLQAGRYSYATAINLFRSIVSFFLLFSSDRLARLLTHGEQGVF
jgi:ABC transporter, permease protein